MSSKYDFSDFQNKLTSIRTDRLNNDPNVAEFCDTQENLAVKLGVGRRTVWTWEQGKCDPRMSNMIELCEVLNIDMNYLLGVSETPLETDSEVANYLNLPIRVVAKLKKDPLMQRFLAHMISSDFLTSLLERGRTIVNTRTATHDLLNIFKESLRNQIDDAFSDYLLSNAFEDYSEISFVPFLREKITYRSCKSLIDHAGSDSFDSYLERAFVDVADFRMMLEQSPGYDPKKLESAYEKFIETLASWTFQPLFNQFSYERSAIMFSQNFLNMLDDFWNKEMFAMKEKLHAEALRQEQTSDV